MDTYISEILKWAGWIIASGALLFAIKGNIHFDVNQWLKDRRKQKEENLRYMCPHVRLYQNEASKPAFHSTFISPPGTTAFICSICGTETYDQDYINKVLGYWANNPKEFFDRNRRIKKELKSLGRL